MVLRFIEVLGSDTTAEVIGARGVLGVTHVVEMLVACNYSPAEIVVVLGHAAQYCSDFSTAGGFTGMVAGEKFYVVNLFIFLAHSYVLDETCPLVVWHKNIFKSYCDLATLNQALMALMKRRNFILRVDDSQLLERMCHIRGTPNTPCTAIRPSRGSVAPADNTGARTRRR